MMGDLDAQELAQLGLKHIEDAVVGLLSGHDNGLTDTAIAERLGLAEGHVAGERIPLAKAVLELLVASGRILRNRGSGVYRDNPDKI
jgi:hypothetical protein